MRTSQTSRARQFFAPLIATLMLALSLVIVNGSLSASATGGGGSEPCVETPDQTVTDWFESNPGAPWVATGESRIKTEGADPTYTQWADEGGLITTHDNTPPGADTDTVRYLPAGTVKHVTQEATEDTEVFDYWQRYSLTGGTWGEGVPEFPNPGDPFGWVPNVKGDPHRIGQAGAYSVSQGQSGNTDWFYLEAVTKTVEGQDELSHTDYFWQKQVRTLTPGSDDVIEYEYTKTIEGQDCPPPDEKKVVVCKYTGTPPGGLSHIIIVDESSLNNVEDAEGNSFDGTFPFSWTDAHGQTQEGSVAIRYAEDGEQAKDVSLAACPSIEVEPEEIAVPAAPSVTDPCGAGNASWNVPADTAVLDWEVVDGDLIVTILAEDTVFEGTGETTYNFGAAVETNTALCVEEIAVPAAAQVSDPCGAGNAEWIVPGDGDTFEWEVVDGDLIVTIVAENTVFEDTGESTYNFGQALETNAEECEVLGEQLEVPAAPEVSDPCGAGNAEWIVPDDNETFEWEVVDGDLIVTILTENTVFEGTDETTYNFGQALETNVEECEVLGEQLEIPAAPEMSDPCGAGNAEWIVPADTKKLDWTLTDGVLSVEITAPDTVFEGTEDTTYSFGKAVETNKDACEVKGEQGNPPMTVQVKGEQAVAPAVPSAVNAGIGIEESPLGSGRNPLWLLAVGGGLGLMGSAGLRRRATANR